jgi:hypothetical protein
MEDYGLDICEADPCARQVGAIPTMVDPGYAMRRDDEPRPESSVNVAPFWILSHEATVRTVCCIRTRGLIFVTYLCLGYQDGYPDSRNSNFENVQCFPENLNNISDLSDRDINGKAHNFLIENVCIRPLLPDN